MPDPLRENWFKPEVLSQSGYHVDLPPCKVKLNQNESPWDLPEDIKGEILGRLGKIAWNRYPDLMAVRIKNKLAKTLNMNSDQIVVGKGSNEILQAIYNVVLGPSDTVCTLSPTFAVYRLLAEQRSCKVSTVSLGHGFRVQGPELLGKVRKAKLTVIANPNSPTGSLVPLEMIRQLLEASGALVVVDEAYVQFSGLTALSLLKQHPNLIITRTFSKAFALAGFRVGYAVMRAEIRSEVQKGLLPFNLDMPSAISVGVLLDHSVLIEDRARQIVKERDELINELNALDGVKAWPSHANFFLLETPLGGRNTFEALLGQGILVRDVTTYPRCESMVRITVGTPEENRALYRGVKRIL